MATMILITTTVADADTARRIAEDLVNEKLAACVEIQGHVASTFWWQGAVEQENEVGLSVKTSATRRQACAQRLKALHPYDLPVIAWWEVQVMPEVDQWLVESLRD